MHFYDDDDDDADDGDDELRELCVIKCNIKRCWMIDREIDRLAPVCLLQHTTAFKFRRFDAFPSYVNMNIDVV